MIAAPATCGAATTTVKAIAAAASGDGSRRLPRNRSANSSRLGNRRRRTMMADAVVAAVGNNPKRRSPKRTGLTANTGNGKTKIALLAKHRTLKSSAAAAMDNHRKTGAGATMKA